ncbi:anthranilate phosphoribosyltransferase [Streptomyces sp. NPDC050145]|uniref:anthranilate phosphoribosyltransferase n=1 Tax=Streptomyces sp. NPDC050145 TaxID=3365602 RepID=UPI00379649DD
MHDALVTLIGGDRPVERESWRSLWDRLHDGGLRRGEAVALLASLSTAPPRAATLTALLDSLDERRPPLTVPFQDTVNIVGTGGGPRTFNISTAAALTAAAMGVRVVKTGSRAYTSGCGSMDLLEILGIDLTRSYEETAEVLDREGVAFAGTFVYPAEIGLLARAALPLDLRDIGRFVNVLGPFLAGVPVTAQLTGVSDPRRLPAVRQAAEHTARRTGRTVWVCTNDLGADELLGIVPNRVRTYEGGGEDEFTLRPQALGLSSGHLGDLAPVTTGRADVARHFLDLLRGAGDPVAEQAVCLNAAALAVAGRLTADWHAALTAARTAIHDGSVHGLVERLRTRAVSVV